MDFNPLLILVANQMAKGDRLSMYEFPIAPKSLEDDAVLRKLSAPERAGENFHLVLGDALRAPFAAGSFDTVVTPWLIDIITEDLPVFAARINRLLRNNGRWVNFGSLAFSDPGRARRYSPEETKAIVSESGFSDPYVSPGEHPLHVFAGQPSRQAGTRVFVLRIQGTRRRTGASTQSLTGLAGHGQ
jgi:hypothetical protein